MVVPNYNYVFFTLTFTEVDKCIRIKRLRSMHNLITKGEDGNKAIISLAGKQNADKSLVTETYH